MTWLSSLLVTFQKAMPKKKVREKSRKCHNHKPFQIPRRRGRQVCFNSSIATQRAINNIPVAQVLIQGAAICAQLRVPDFVTGVVKNGFAVGIRVLSIFKWLKQR